MKAAFQPPLLALIGIPKDQVFGPKLPKTILVPVTDSGPEGAWPQMDAMTREQRRQEISKRRIRPQRPQRIHFPAAGLGESIEIDPLSPLELCIESTDSQGMHVPWLTDEWWINIQAVCKDRTVTVVILPTPDAVLDSVVLHQLEMLRRITPHWHLVGYSMTETAAKESEIDRWVNTPFDEIRFCEDEMASHNGAATSVRKLVKQSESMPKMHGFHQTQLRLIKRYPYSFKTGAIEHEDARTPDPSNMPDLSAQHHRVSHADAVQSS